MAGAGSGGMTGTLGAAGSSAGSSGASAAGAGGGSAGSANLGCSSLPLCDDFEGVSAGAAPDPSKWTPTRCSRTA